MKRKIVEIDQTKCNGCGLCIQACHEGALQLVDGKAQLVSDSYCDGLGACLPECPADAIRVIEREAAAFDAEAVASSVQAKNQTAMPERLAGGCPGTQARTIERKTHQAEGSKQTAASAQSQLRQWPCQIKLAPAHAPYFQKAHLLVAADCTAYAYADIHNGFMRDKITIIGCPKLDEGDYSEKLTQILQSNDIQSVTVLRMEVPCCSGIVKAVKTALTNSGTMIPWNVVTIGTGGHILDFTSHKP